MKTISKLLCIAFCISGILTAIMLMRGYSFTKPVEAEPITRDTIVMQLDTLAVTLDLPGNLTDEQVAELLKVTKLAIDLRVQHPDIFIAQVIQETHWCSSDLYRTRNNVMGMKKAMVRPTTRVQDNDTNPFAKYKTVKASVLDYYIWQIEYANNLTEKEYYERLKTYEPIDPDKYLHKIDSLRTYSKQLINYVNAGKY